MKSQNTNAAIENFTAWKVGNIGMHVQVRDSFSIVNPLIADTRVMFHSSNRDAKGGSKLRLEEPVFISQSENMGVTLESGFSRKKVKKKDKGSRMVESERQIELYGGAIFGREGFVKHSKGSNGNKHLTPKLIEMDINPDVGSISLVGDSISIK